MQELRFVAVSEDGSYAVLAIPGRSGRYILPIDERLRAVALGQTSRLAQYEIEVESPLRPKEIQARIRAGETAEEIADAAGIPVERVRWFEGPVLAERAYIASQAQSGSVRRTGDSAGPGPRLGDIVTERLSSAGTDPADGQWDSRKRGDGNWQVSLTFPSGGRLHVAEWVFDPRRRHVMPDDDNAARLSLPESDLPAEPVPMPGEATVTPIAPRLGAAAGMGGGVSAPGVSRFRPDRSVIPDRSLGADRSLAERPAVMPDRAAAGLSDRTAAPAPQAPPRSGQQDRPSHAGRPADPGYAEFPESAPYRAPEPAPAPEPPAHREPRGYNDPASVSGAFLAPTAEPPAQHGYEDPAAVPSAYRTVAEPPPYRDPAPEPRGYRDPLGFRPPAAEPPAYGERGTEPAADHAPADEIVAVDQPERIPVTPQRPVAFEDPAPTFHDPQPEPSGELSPGHRTPRSYDAAPAPSAPALPAWPDPLPGPPAVAAPVEVSRRATADSMPSSSGEAERQPPDPAAGYAPAPAAEAQAPSPAPAAAPGPNSASEPTDSEPGTPAAAVPAPAAEPAAEEPGPAAPGQQTEALDPAEPESSEAAEAQAARRSGRKNAKGRRSSVPSWDEIMLGSSRQHD